MKEFLKRTILPLAAQLFFVRPGNRKSFDALRENLELSGAKIKERIANLDANSSNSEKTTKVLRHIIAIERWGQRRLMVFFGEPFQMDENYAYKPDKSMSWGELQESFAETRAKTVEITRSLATKTGVEEQTVKHNDFGDITAKAWLQYLTVHANIEARGMK